MVYGQGWWAPGSATAGAHCVQSDALAELLSAASQRKTECDLEEIALGNVEASLGHASAGSRCGPGKGESMIQPRSRRVVGNCTIIKLQLCKQLRGLSSYSLRCPSDDCRDCSHQRLSNDAGSQTGPSAQHGVEEETARGGRQCKSTSSLFFRLATGWLTCLLLFSCLRATGAESSNTDPHDGTCSELEATDDAIRTGHVCLGCEWVHVAGASRVPRVNGLYRRAIESKEQRRAGKFSWFYGGEALRLQWSDSNGGAWLIQSEAQNSTYYLAQDASDNPVLVAPRIWKWYNSTDSMHNSAEKTLRVQCVATPGEFKMRAGIRELVSFGFNFYGELGRDEKLLTLEPVSSPGVVRHFGTYGDSQYVKQVSVGCNHGLALTREGHVWAWGSNAMGQLGRSENAGTAKANYEPKIVDAMQELSRAGTIESVASGGTFSMVRLRTHVGVVKVFTAGSNRYGQLARQANLGYDTFNPVFAEMQQLPFFGTKAPTNIVAMAAGRHHALVRTSDNLLYSWGNNKYGQLGRSLNEGTDNYNPDPSWILPSYFANEQGQPETPELLALGRFHSLVVTSEGSLFCFGSNLRGQCGPMIESSIMGPHSYQPGSDAPNSLPRLLARSLFGNERVVAVAAGQYSTLVQTHDGRVWGFGRNYFGHLTAGAGGVGYGSPVSIPYYVDISARRNSSGIRQFAVGADHTMIVFKDDGYGGTPDLVGLGSNAYGQLGSDPKMVGGRVTVTEATFTPSKEALRCGTTFLRGHDTSVGACATGYMRAIGVATSCDQTVLLTERPQCPPGTSSSDSGLQPCSICPGGTYQPDAGASTCLECAQGLFSFAGSTACLSCPIGFNTTASITNETGCLRICEPGEYGVQQHLGIQGLAPCAKCGADEYSEEFGSSSCKRCPEGFGSTTEGLSNSSQCRRYCGPGYRSVDGLERDGECLLCPAGTSQPSNRSTMCLGCAVGKFSLSGGSSCTDCARGKYSNNVNASSCTLCDYGKYQTGFGQTSCSTCGSDRSTNLEGATNESDCRVTVFQVWGVGNNEWGQLGAGFVLTTTEPVNTEALQVANDVGNPRRGLNNSQVLSVSAGFSHTLFLTVEGSLWASGQNDYGQLGRTVQHMPSCNFADGPDLVCRYNPRPNPVPTLIDRVNFQGRSLRKVLAGRHLSVALTCDKSATDVCHNGHVYTWGYNRYGQLGRPDNVGTDLPNWQPQVVGATFPSHVKDIAVGSFHVLILAHDGTVWTFGLNRFGQLGREANKGLWAPNWEAVQINPQELSAKKVVSMAAGASHSLLLTEDRNLWAFGSNAWGQVGSPQQAFVWGGLVHTPLKVMSGVLEVVAGGKHSVARKAQNKLFGFGSNYYGQLASRTAIGDGTATPVELQTNQFANHEIVRIAAGGDNTAVQTVNGSEGMLWLFGSNRFGQLGVQQNSGEWNFNPDPIALTTCELMDQSWCDSYTLMDSSVGTDFLMIQTGARVCPPGTIGPPPFGRPGTSASCEKCAAGTYSSSEGSTACANCGRGNFSNPGSSFCTQCVRGKYSDTDNAGACTECPSGKTMPPSTSRASIHECLQNCPPGSASASPILVNGQLIGSGECEVCPAGKFSNVSSAIACTACPRASYSEANSSSCTDCETGKTTYQSGGANAADCVLLCPAGKYSAPSSFGECIECATGKYSTLPGAEACMECPGGFGTRGPGQQECFGVCQPGTFGEYGLQGTAGDGEQGTTGCYACPAGKFAGEANSTVCFACPAGKVSSEGASFCTGCEPGNHAAEDAARCEPCGPGYFQPFPGKMVCEPCPVGSYVAVENATGCIPCSPGFTTNGKEGANECIACPAGTSLQLDSNNVSSCQTCSPGSFAVAGAANCSLCAQGFYSAEPGAAQCMRCASGITQRRGAINVSECVAFESTSVVLGQPLADALSGLELDFVPHMEIATDESVWLGLPGFSIHLNGINGVGEDGVIAVELAGMSSDLFLATWENATEERPFEALRLRVKGYLPALERLALRLANGVAVRVPMLGMRRCQARAGLSEGKDIGKKCVSLSTDAASGPVRSPVPVENAPVVGSFGGSSTVQWHGHGIEEGLGVAMTSMMTLGNGDVISFYLPQFMLASSSSTFTTLSLEGRSAEVFASSAVWHDGNRTLVLTVAGTGTEIVLEENHSITLRVRGLTLQQGCESDVLVHGMTISSVAAAGNVLTTNISRACRARSVTMGKPATCCEGGYPRCLVVC